MKNTFLRFICGNVRFSAQGMFPERFINLAMHSNASLWDIRRDNDGFSACVIANRYKLLRYAAAKTKTRIKLVSKHGLPFILLPYRHRAGFVLGFIFFCLTIWTMSNFIWIVEFPETDDELQIKLQSVAYEAGIHPGRLRSSLDGEALSNVLEANIGDISWASVNIFGSRLSVDIREYESFPKKISLNEPCNLVAAKGGVITDVNPKSGFVEVKKGDVVVPGDLLISGVVDDAMGSVTLVHAMGSITARTDYRFTETISFEQTEPLTTGRIIKIRRIIFFGLEIPLYLGKEPDGEFIKTRTQTPVKIGSHKLPVSYVEESWVETAVMTHIISERDAVSRATDLIDKRIEELGDIEIISRNDKINRSKNAVTVTVDFSVLQDIAKEEIILFD